MQIFQFFPILYLKFYEYKFHLKLTEEFSLLTFQLHLISEKPFFFNRL